MKKIALLLVFSLSIVVARASKAWAQPQVVKQSDGTELTIRLNGDVNFNWVSTTDGVILQQKGSDFYIAVIDDSGNLSASTQLAHDAPLRSASECALIAKQNKEVFFRSGREITRAIGRRNEQIQANSRLFPHTGSPKAIVILAQFSNLNFTVNARKAFDQYLNSMDENLKNFGHHENRNHASVKKYFSDMSNGQFTPQFDVYGPVTLPQTMEYYGAGNSRFERYHDLVTDACTLMDDSLDFSQYDSNNDGYVDLVYVIYAGYGENMAPALPVLWPKAFPHGGMQKDGKTIGICGISNELLGNPQITKHNFNNIAPITGIGLFCHEFSHCLGLPDFYNTVSTTAQDNQGMEDWSLMDNGIYGDNGFTPPAYTAWEREAMGWMTIDTLKTTQQVKLENIDKGGKAYRIMNDANPSKQEYYIVQNIQKYKWNAKTRGVGMLVYHVNYDADDFGIFGITGSNRVNTVIGKPRMTVIPADNRLVSSYRRSNGSISSQEYKTQLAGDPFPGTAATTELSDANPRVNYAPWTGGTLNKPIYNISMTGDVVYFDFLQKFSTADIAPSISKQKPEDNKIYSLDGRYVGTDKTRLPKGIYILNRKKFVVQ